MIENLKQHLIKKYSQFTSRDTKDCIKLHYQYKGVSINLYFDYYEKLFTSSLVLIYENIYYYNSLNIDTLINPNKKPYLDNLPPEIIHQIRDKNNKLQDFYDAMRQHLISENLEQTTYNDAIFQRGINAHRDNTRNPFLSHLRKTPMSETHLDFLNKNLNIPRKALKDLQKRGFTIVTTANLQERKSITLILQQEGIFL